MATDAGNAVDARWVGPSGHQLFDGSILTPGDIVHDLGYDEVKDNPYWDVVKKVSKDDVVVSDAAVLREDWSFGTEEGGEGTGRPELKTQTASLEAPAPDPIPPDVEAGKA